MPLLVVVDVVVVVVGVDVCAFAPNAKPANAKANAETLNKFFITIVVFLIYVVLNTQQINNTNQMRFFIQKS